MQGLGNKTWQIVGGKMEIGDPVTHWMNLTVGFPSIIKEILHLIFYFQLLEKIIGINTISYPIAPNYL